MADFEAAAAAVSTLNDQLGRVAETIARLRPLTKMALGPDAHQILYSELLSLDAHYRTLGGALRFLRDFEQTARAAVLERGQLRNELGAICEVVADTLPYAEGDMSAIQPVTRMATQLRAAEAEVAQLKAMRLPRDEERVVFRQYVLACLAGGGSQSAKGVADRATLSMEEENRRYGGDPREHVSSEHPEAL